MDNKGPKKGDKSNSRCWTAQQANIIASAEVRKIKIGAGLEKWYKSHLLKFRNIEFEVQLGTNGA